MAKQKLTRFTLPISQLLHSHGLLPLSRFEAHYQKEALVESLGERLGGEVLLQEASSGVTGHKPRRVAFVTQDGETIMSFASAESKGSGTHCAHPTQR